MHFGEQPGVTIKAFLPVGVEEEAGVSGSSSGKEEIRKLRKYENTEIRKLRKYGNSEIRKLRIQKSSSIKVHPYYGLAQIPFLTPAFLPAAFLMAKFVETNIYFNSLAYMYLSK